MKKTIALLFAFAFTTIIYSCTYNKGEDVKPNVITGLTYNNSIKGIVERRCTQESGCHGADPGSQDFTTYAGLTESYYIDRMSNAINHRTGAIAMPQGLPKLPQAEIDSIDSWLVAEYPEN
jgi:hypothetical protein